ncbi:hypothetical protein FOCC_FOCC001148 [Frankliniella occidentalis]|nr:hypothetical protein FOCC_FOCC001148 [Frankliniella occidentalis]
MVHDGSPLASDAAQTPGVVARTLDDFSTALTFPALQPAHSGNYTCELRNDAAVATRSAQVVVTATERSPGGATCPSRPSDESQSESCFP